MKYLDWNEEKNEHLKKERGVSFEEVQLAIEEGRAIAILNHPNKEQYAHQYVLVVEIDKYIYLVPFVEDEEKLFLKTIIPSRKATKDYTFEEKG